MFVSQRIKSSANSNNFQFNIVERKSKMNSDLTFDASEELRNLTRNDTGANRRKKTIFGSGEERGKPLESVSTSEEDNG